jgi:hypothetical protein
MMRRCSSSATTSPRPTSKAPSPEGVAEEKLQRENRRRESRNPFRKTVRRRTHISLPFSCSAPLSPPKKMMAADAKSRRERPEKRAAEAKIPLRAPGKTAPPT